MKLPKAEQSLAECQAAMEPPIMAAEGHVRRCSRVVMLPALNLHVERVFNTDCKGTNWGKRKLNRDE